MNERQIAYNVIYKVVKKNEFSTALLHKEAKKLKANNGNHEFFYNLVKGIIKRKLYLEYICCQFGDAKKYPKTDLKIKVLLWLGLYQILYMDSVPSEVAVSETVELTKTLYSQKSGDFVNAMLRNYLRNPEITYPEDPIERISVEHSYPVELISQWVNIFGIENTEYMAMYFNELPEINIRVNNYATSMDKLLPYFEKKGVSFTKYDGIADVVKADKAQTMLQDVAFSEGYFSIQDAAASLVVTLLDPQFDENIIDFFAAPGGKTSYMSELMQNTGQIIAIDKFPNKVKLIKQALERLQLSNVKLVKNDALTYGPVAAAYDKILLDVPCSGWGVLGKKSELRWQSHQNILDLIKLQTNALNYASKFVKVGGYIIYSTCTLNPAENEERIEMFLKKHPNFIIENAENYINTRYVNDGYLKTVPHIHSMDGAFGARLKRIN